MYYLFERLGKTISCFLISLSQMWLLNAQPINQEFFLWRNIGPANQGGRIIDVEALNNDFTRVWIATGSGGVWHSSNAGTTWTPIFDRYSTASIGDIAIDQSNPNTIWVGTGEANNRNSVSWGDGVFLSEDGGKNFVNKGLQNTHHISRVVIDPVNSDKVCVCATGHLWGLSGDRGFFISADKGNSWEKKTIGLPEDPTLGCTDLVIHPDNPRIMYMAMYYRMRKPWTFTSGNENGGIFKSEDGGETWVQLTQGLPQGPTGRIGLAIYKSDPNVIMALVEAEKTDDLDIPGSGVYRSENAGETWSYINTYNNRPFYYSQIRINPLNDQRVYLLTTSFMVSDDGGKTFHNGNEDQEVHGDFHAMWLDPNYQDRYYLGADKGMSITHDHGDHFQLFDNLPIGQFYRISVDHSNPYRVFGGLQDNGFYGISSFSRDIRGVLNDSNWKLHWGDGQYSASDPSDPSVLYTSAENGSFFTYDIRTYFREAISPRVNNIENLFEYLDSSALETRPFRFNWSAPLVMSSHRSNTLFAAGNHIFRSDNHGKSWKIISPDLSTSDSIKILFGKSGGITPDNTGAETHCSVTSLSVSPVDESIIWAGTDDGQVHLTQNAGRKWSKINPQGAPEIWVSRLEASHFHPNRAYLTLDSHRSDLFKPFVFMTDDYGQHWTDIATNLPENEVVRVIREDIENENLLFIGTETGIWMSLNRGQNWQRIKNGFPTVSVYDMVIHPRDHELVVGTHGRSIWILDHLWPLQQMSRDVINKPFYLFEQEPAVLWKNKSRGGQRGHFWFGGDNPAEIRPVSSLPRAEFDVDAFVAFYCGIQKDTNFQLEIIGQQGSLDSLIRAKPGINLFRWNRLFDIHEYSEEELKNINTTFDQYLKTNSSNTLRRQVTRFRDSNDIREKRKIVQALKDGFLKIPLADSLGLIKAGQGLYKIMLTLGDETQVKYLTLKPDSLKE